MIIYTYLKTLIRQKIFKYTTRQYFKDWQQKQIKRFLRRQLPKTPYYIKFLKEKDIRLEELQIMNKKEFMKNFSTLNTKGIKLSKAENLARISEKDRDFSPTYKGVSIGLSSGTSGRRGMFLTTRKEQSMWAGTILAKLRINILKKNRIALFLRANNNLYESLNTPTISFKYFDLLKPLSEQYEELVEYNPSILVSPPSVLREIIRMDKCSLKPKRIISVAEVLGVDDKKIIEKHFSVRIEQIYQATEGFIGFTCDKGVLHLNEDGIYIEKQWLDKKRFIPIITDFNRSTQTIIRYRLDDILTAGNPCSCGLPFMTIRSIDGRLDDVFYLPKGKDIIPVFPDFLCRNMPYELEDFLIEQTGKNEIRINIKKASKRQLQETKKNLEGLFNTLGVHPLIKYSSTLERNPGVKRRRVVNLMKTRDSSSSRNTG